MKPLQVTVGISTLDRPEGLQRCLDALLAGDRRPDELIVVDQGVDARTPQLLAAYESEIPLAYIRQPRRGLSASRNAVVRSARYPIVAVTDDDCVPHRGWLRALAEAFSDDPVPDAVSGRVLALGPETPGTYAVSLRDSDERRDFIGDALPWVVGTGANFAVRRDWLGLVGGYDERLGTGSPGFAGEDLDLSFRLLRAGARIRYEPGAMVEHERMNEQRRLATRWTYGHGIGAICGMLCRRRDRFGVVMLSQALRQIAARSVRAVAAVDWSDIRQAGLSLSGTASGFRYGWGTGLRAPLTSLNDHHSNDASNVAV